MDMGSTVVRRNSAYWEPLAIALETMRAHKLRSFLMLLGIILSVSTLIVVVALIQGTNRYIADKVANMGSNVFLVEQLPLITNAEQFTKALRRNRKITWEDYEYLHGTMRLPKDVGVETRTQGKVRYNGQEVQDVNVRGVTANIGSMDIEEPATGRYVSDFDNEHRSMVTMMAMTWLTASSPAPTRSAKPSSWTAANSKSWVRPSPWVPCSASHRTISFISPCRRS